MSNMLSTTGNGIGGVNGQTDFSSPRLESHMTFVCPECGEEFESQQDWRRHLNEEHDYLHKTPADFDFKEINENFHECQVCHKWVANANQAIALLQYHRFLHLPFNRTYRCRHCKGGFTRKRALCEHLYRFHSRKIIEFEQQRHVDGGPTAVNEDEQTALRDPEQNSEFYLRFTCPLCGRNIDRFDQWLEHLNTHQTTSTDLRMHRITGSRNHYCLQCKKLLYTIEHEKLQRHRFMHLPFRMYFKCAFCMVKKSFKSEIFRHFVYAHPRKFAEAKDHIQKPVEWGAKISDRLSAELDLMLKRNKYPGCKINTLVLPALMKKRIGRPKKNRELIEKEIQSIKDAQAKINPRKALSNDGKGKSANEQALDRSLQDFENISKQDKLTGCNEVLQTLMVEQFKDSDVDDSEDFKELCTEMFEAFDSESSQHAQQTAVRYKTENDKDVEEIISIEIDAVQENCESITQSSFIRTPPRKRIKLSEDTAPPPAPVPNKTPKDVRLDVEQQKEMLESHILYLCPECGSEFEESTKWRQHVFIEHNLGNAIQTSFQLLENNSSYLCLDCMTVQHTVKYSELQRHRFTHMPFQTYLKCKLCFKTKTSKPKMLDHLRQCHSSLLAKSKLENSGATHAAPASQLISCNDCGKYFPTQNHWRAHRPHCGQRVNGVRLGGSSNSSSSNSNIANNLRLLAHLKSARLRIEKLKVNAKC